MKKLKSLMLLATTMLVLAAVFCMNASALDKTGKCGENVYWSYNDKTCELIISGTGPMDDYVVYESGYDDWSDEYFYYEDEYSTSPFDDAVVKTLTVKNGVTSIGSGSFYDIEELRSVSLPESLTSIGKKAFYKSGIVSITIPENVEVIERYAFKCESLESIYVNENNPYYSSSEDGVLFNKDKTELVLCPSGYTGIEYVVPDSVTGIKYDSFIGVDNIISVTIPESVVQIDACGFTSCACLSDIYYCGTQEQWNEMIQGYYCEKWGLINMHYDYVYNPDCTHSDRINHASIASTCAENGFTAGVYCSDCEKWIEGHKRIPLSKSHPNAENRPMQKPTCTIRGYEAGIYCPDCEKWLSGHRWINAKGHTFTEKLIDADHLVSEATAEGPAVYRVECANEGCNELSPDKTFTFDGTIGKPVITVKRYFESQVSIGWKEIPAAAGYRVYKKTPTGWEKVKTVTSTGVAIKNLDPNTEYTFAVRAAAIIDGEVIWSDTYTTFVAGVCPPKPSAITAVQNASAIKLSWNACRGATGYRIYYTTDADNALKICVSSTKAISHTFKNLKPGSKYQFFVRPYKQLSTGEVVWSEYNFYTTATTPSTVAAKASSPSKGKISLTWNNVSGDIDGYRVYYKVGNGAYKAYKNYSTAQKLTFSNLKSGTKYTFAVLAGIRTSGGVVWSTYKEAAVTVK